MRNQPIHNVWRQVSQVPEHFWRHVAVIAAVTVLAIANVWSVQAKGGGKVSLVLQSSAFMHNMEMPTEYTCEGANISPPLEWHGVPETAKSLVLICDDPDAPDPAKPLRVWVHWLLYNLPATSSGLPAAVSEKQLPAGVLPGTNDRGMTGYHGPCPPIGRHRYFFKLYALDTVLPDLKEPKKADLLTAMKGHIIAETELIGTYQKHK